MDNELDLKSRADFADHTCDSWDEDYRRMWIDLQVAEHNKLQYRKAWQAALAQPESEHGKEAELAAAKREAEDLAMTIWRRRYRDASPNFSLCDSVPGVISQIDNMVAGLLEDLERNPEPEQLGDGWEEWIGREEFDAYESQSCGGACIGSVIPSEKLRTRLRAAGQGEPYAWSYQIGNDPEVITKDWNQFDIAVKAALPFNLRIRRATLHKAPYERPVPRPESFPATEGPPRDEHIEIVTAASGTKVDVDASIAPLVKALNNAGIETIASCSGHSERPGNIALTDGRELFILPNYESAREAEKFWPDDVNGDAMTPRPESGGVVPGALRKAYRAGFVAACGWPAPLFQDTDSPVFAEEMENNLKLLTLTAAQEANNDE